MEISDTTKATIIPVINRNISCPVSRAGNCNIFNRLAPNITGTAMKNVNSVATNRETPIIRAPTIVAPERDVPGNTAAINWKNPIIKAV